MDLGHGGAAIGLALAVEAFLVGAEIGDAGLDLGLEINPDIGSRRGRLRRDGNGRVGQEGVEIGDEGGGRLDRRSIGL